MTINILKKLVIIIVIEGIGGNMDFRDYYTIISVKE